MIGPQISSLYANAHDGYSAATGMQHLAHVEFFWEERLCWRFCGKAAKQQLDSVKLLLLTSSVLLHQEKQGCENAALVAV